MTAISDNNFIDKINKFSSRLLLPVMAILFVCTNTVLNKWIDERAESIQNIFAIIAMMIVALNVLSNGKKGIKSWLKLNILVVVYFLARFISWWQCGFDYSVLRTIVFEAFYLIGICAVTLDKNNCSKFYIKFFIWFELIMTALSIAIYYAMPIFSQGVQASIAELTYFEKCGSAMLFSNPNTAGIMAGFGVVISIMYYRKNYFSNVFLKCYGLYNVVAMCLFDSRGAEIGVVLAVVAAVIIKAFPKIGKKNLTAVVLILMVASLIPIYLFVNYNEKIEALSMSNIESNIDDVTTGRYVIWKECVIVQQDNPLFGFGNLRLEQQARAEYVSTFDQSYYWRYVWASDLGPHNGYIGMISATGWVGFALFIAILLQRIKRAKNLENGNLYLMLIFIFVINCFESLFILNRFFTCFYMFMILQSDVEEKEALPEEALL